MTSTLKHHGKNLAFKIFSFFSLYLLSYDYFIYFPPEVTTAQYWGLGIFLFQSVHLSEVAVTISCIMTETLMLTFQVPDTSRFLPACDVGGVVIKVKRKTGVVAVCYNWMFGLKVTQQAA